MSDPVNHPSHYNAHPSGVEAIDIIEHFTFNVGNAVKYLWRAGLKSDLIEDLKKARAGTSIEKSSGWRRSVRTDVLDHGYIELVESWGSDERIVEAARMSTGKGFLGWGPKHAGRCASLTSELRAVQNDCDCGQREPGDEKLLRYLWQHKHATPFEMAGLIIEVQAPIFVFREWHRHRTQSYNELSARYTPLPDVNYVPSIERLLQLGGANKQAVGLDGKTLDSYNAEVWRQELTNLYAEAQRVYQLGLELGVPKELARLPVPVARYSRMRAGANLRNWLAFLTLRMDAAAQWEIRQYANAVGDIIAKAFPRTWSLFTESI